MSARALKPFRFDNLERLTRQQVDLHAGVLRYLPRALPAQMFVDQVAAQLKKYMGEPVQMELSALREPKYGKYRESVPDPAILFVFSCVPLLQKAVLQVDFALAHILVDRMLGGSGEQTQDLRPITSIEEGVLQFLILKILTILAEATAGSEVQFRLDSILTEPAPLKDLGGDEDLLALLSVQITIGKKAGFVRLALPHPLVEGLLTALTPQEGRVTVKDVRRLDRLSDVKMPVWIELGRVDIGSVDLTHLEKGDVVLVDEIFVEIGDEGVTGPVILRVHHGVGGGFRGQILESKSNSISVQIDEAF